MNIAIELDAQDAEFINQKLKYDLEINKSYAKKQWDKEVQLRKNQPLMKLIKQWREEKKGQTATEEEIQEYRDIQESLKRK
ncbi:MAG: hypothetical protein AB4372_10220 [Xenococcus sp. (in: cyanobacteria)]